MENIRDFFRERCESDAKENSDIVLLKTDYEKIEIQTNDECYSNLRYLTLHKIVRFLNPKVNFKTILRPDFVGNDDEDDFDIGIQQIDKMEIPLSNEMISGSEELLYLYFLPSHIETKLKNITCGLQRTNIDSRLKLVIPDEIIKDMELSFKEISNDMLIDYEQRKKHATSFYKFFKEDENTECNTIEEIEYKVNQVKYNLGIKFVESMDYYFIGDIQSEIGLLERDISEAHENPLYYHLNFWKLSEVSSNGIWSEFNLYPFCKEVLENAN